MQRAKPFSVILILCLGIIAYSNTFFCSFQLDDDYYIVHNLAIRNIYNIQNIWDYFHGRFLTFLSIAFNYHINGFNVFGYHLFNLAVHLGSAILAWWLTLLTLSTPAMKEDKITQHANLVALFVGLVFVAHPVQTEAVTYICQRAASMAALFYLASLCFYVKSRLLQDSVFAGEAKVLIPDTRRSSRSLRKVYYIGALITAVAAMFTKENTVTLPLVILFYEFTFLKIKGRLDWKRITPFLLTIFIVPVTFLFIKSQTFQQMHGDLRAAGGILTSGHYLLTQFRTMFTYIRLVFLPIGQNIDYDYPVFKNFFELPVLISFIFLMIIFSSALRLFSRYRLISFSIFWFFLTLILPESSYWVMGEVVQEHRLYLPLVGYSIFLVSGMYYLFGKNNIKTMVMTLSLIIFCFSVLTYQRNQAWKDGFTLWDDTVQKSPLKARPHNNRGELYFRKGDAIDAMLDLNKAIELDPNYAEAYNNRGLVYIQQGNFTKAMLDINKSIGLEPYYAEAYSNRGYLYLKTGNLTQANSDLNKAVELNPDIAGPYVNRGFMFFKLGNLSEAFSNFCKAIELDPNNAEAYNDRGSILGEGNYFTQAVSDLTKAIEINPAYAEAYYNRAGIYYQLKEFDNALADVHKAEGLGYHVAPGFISALKRASARYR